MSDVFISYKRRLRPQVERLAMALRDLRIDVWFDAALEPGVSFSAEISNEVRNAGCVLVCFSDDAFPHGGDENGWVLGEASIGKKRGRLVTVMLDETEFDPPWNMIHTERLVGFDPADFTAERAGWRGALAAMGRLIDRPGLADYDRAIVAGTAEALKGWVQKYPKDALAESVWAKVEEIELAQVRRRLAEERVKPPEPPVPPKPVEPERIYEPMPQPVPNPEPQPIPRPEPVPKPKPIPAPAPTPGPATTPPFSPPVAAAVACLIAATGAVVFAVFVGDYHYGPLFGVVVFGGPAAAMILLSTLLVLSGYLKVWRAIVLAVAGYGGFFLAELAGEFVTWHLPASGYDGADVAGGFTMGVVGALILLVALMALGRIANFRRAVPIALGGVLLAGGAIALVMAIPGVSLRSEVIWLSPLWFVAMGVVLFWLLTPGIAAPPISAAAPAAAQLNMREVLLAGLISFAACSAGNFVLLHFGPNSALVFAVIVLGGAAFVAPIAWLVDRHRAWPRRNAVLLPPIVGVEALLVVLGWSNLNTRFYDLVESALLVGLAGAIGAILAGGTIALLSRQGLRGPIWLVLGITALLEGLALAALIAAVPYLAHSATGFVAIQMLWQAMFVLARPFLLESARLGRPAP